MLNLFYLFKILFCLNNPISNTYFLNNLIFSKILNIFRDVKSFFVIYTTILFNIFMYFQKKKVGIMIIFVNIYTKSFF